MLKKIGIITLSILYNTMMAITLEESLNIRLSNYNVQAFADNIYTFPTLQPERFQNWLLVSNYIKNYILERSTDVFNKQDPTLMAALEMINKANIGLISTMMAAYKYSRTSTRNLSVASQRFMRMADDVAYVINYLEKTTFFRSNKKQAKAMLILWAKYIEINTRKQANDLRNPMILFAVQQETMQQHPPVSYSEEPSFAPPTYRPPVPPMTNPPSMNQ